MNWSFSAVKTFKKCPRKWFYQNVIASGERSKDQLQEKVAYLKDVQSLSAWRGSLVDTVISTYAVPKLNKGLEVDEEGMVDYAMELAKKQVDYACGERSESGDSSLVQCTLFDIEYNGGIVASSLHSALAEVRQSIHHFMKSKFLNEFMQDGLKIISQRTFRHQTDSVNIFATPDIVAFFHSGPPMIVDWKVQASAHTEHWKQLAVYAYVLSKIKPHSDFPEKWNGLLADPTKTRLMEFQLYQGHERVYSLSLADVIEIEDFIFTSSKSMLMMLGDRKYPGLRPEHLPTTTRPSVCAVCQFRKICWESQTL